MRKRTRGRKTETLVHVNAAKAMHFAEQTAARLDGLLRILHLDHGTLDCSEDGVLLLYQTVKSVAAGSTVFSVAEADQLVRQLTAVTESYWKLVALFTGDNRPWKGTLEVLQGLLRGERDPIARAAVQNAWNICRQTAFLAAGGRVLSDEKEGNKADAVSRVHELLFVSLAGTRRPRRGSGRGEALDAE